MACTDAPKGISTADQILVDSLFNIEKEGMQFELDSLCNLEKDRVFKWAVDSISRQRIEEINQIIN
jgi:hypothetical protein